LPALASAERDDLTETPAMAATTLTVKPVAGAIGAEVGGVDL
jgi:hypothetical protein